MPVHKLSFAQGDRERLEVRSADLGKHSWEVLLDGKELTRFSTHEEIVAGRTLTLDDGSTLWVRLDEHTSWLGPSYVLRVERNGALLQDAPAHPSRAIRNAATILWGFGVLTTLSGVLVAFGPAEISPAPDHLRRIVGGLGVLDGLLTMGLGFAASREKRSALIAAIVLFSLQVAGSLAGMNACGALMHSVGLVMLIVALRAHRRLSRFDPAAVAHVFE